MPPLRGKIPGGSEQPGGMIGYPSNRLFEEVAFIAYHFHWPYDQIMCLDHKERQRWVGEVAQINKRLNKS